ncbi:molybdate ABC transporter substrate-binding protein [Actinospongicola halichondriae]|uniref:molybdate ABC transporter substrate-binding protein n=1 Tax=Actinospongicola halichondriae TaxID=3236844 RepID=UPI003D482062
MRRVVAILTVAGALVAGAGCGSGSDDTSNVTVFAAASLADAFVDIEKAFEDAHPDVSVTMNFAGSSSLREQILQGAPADVFASADESNMEVLVAAGAVEVPEPFASNRLRIVVPSGNPAGIRGLDDFADEGLVLGLCAPEVPCGELSRAVLAAAGIAPSPDTEEPDVRALLTKVEAGELDAAIVYVTDVLAAGDRVEGIELSSADNVVTTYPIAAIGDGTGEAALFVAFVLGPEGQAILRARGFERP